MNKKLENSDNCRNKFLFFSPSEKQLSYFTDSLIYIVNHDESGAMGIVINRTTKILTMDLFNSLKVSVKSNIMQRTLLLGGPVNPDAVFVLHSEPEKWSKSIKVNEDIGLTTSSEVLEAIAGDKGPGDYLIALGYSGWNQGQLEEELSENVWIQSPYDFDVLFKNKADDKVDALSKKVGFDLRMVSPDFGNA